MPESDQPDQIPAVQNRPKRRPLDSAVQIVAMLVILAIGYSDFSRTDIVVSSDFLTTFYSAATLVGDGDFHKLYPRPGARDFDWQPFDRATHHLLPDLPVPVIAEYTYSPLVAWIFAPLTMGRPRSALIVWQVTSVLALLVAAVIVNGNGSRDERKSAFDQFWAALVFLPSAWSLWIGQISIVFGLVPIALAMTSLRKRYDKLAGTMFALLFLKQQFLAIGTIVAVAMVFRKRPACLLTMLAVIAVLLGLSIDSSSPAVFLQWFHCLKIADRVYGDPLHGIATHAVISLPRTLLAALPPTSADNVRLLVHACSAVMATATGVLCFRLMKRYKENRSWLPSCFIVLVTALPLVAPYFFVHDLTVLVLASWLFANNSFGAIDKQLLIIHGVLMAAITVYVILLAAASQWSEPAVLVAILALSYIRLYVIFWKHGAAAPIEATTL